jgi:hypothetical protein
MPSSHACGVGVKFSCFSNAGVLPTMTGDNTIAISIIFAKKSITYSNNRSLFGF